MQFTIDNDGHDKLFVSFLHFLIFLWWLSTIVWGGGGGGAIVFNFGWIWSWVLKSGENIVTYVVFSLAHNDPQESSLIELGPNTGTSHMLGGSSAAGPRRPCVPAKPYPPPHPLPPKDIPVYVWHAVRPVQMYLQDVWTGHTTRPNTALGLSTKYF